MYGKKIIITFLGTMTLTFTIAASAEYDKTLSVEALHHEVNAGSAQYSGNGVALSYRSTPHTYTFDGPIFTTAITLGYVTADGYVSTAGHVAIEPMWQQKKFRYIASIGGIVGRVDTSTHGESSVRQYALGGGASYAFSKRAMGLLKYIYSPGAFATNQLSLGVGVDF